MALFPIYGAFQGDFIPHLVAVDTDDTFAEVARKVASHTVGRRLPMDPKSNGYELEIDGEIMNPAQTLGEKVGAGTVVPLHWVAVRFAYA